jgi:hypothetical protein
MKYQTLTKVGMAPQKTAVLALTEFIFIITKPLATTAQN